MARTSLHIRRSEEEAQLIRAGARSEGRTLSSYILNAVMGYMRQKQQLLEARPGSGEAQAPAARSCQKLE